MKCIVCNATLTDYESSLRHAETSAYLDTCMECVKAIGNIPVKGKNELLTELDLDSVDALIDDDSEEYLDEQGYDDDYYKDLWDER